VFEQTVLSAQSKANPRYRAMKALKNCRFLKTPMRTGKPARKAKKALWDSDDEAEDGPLEEIPMRQ
jgi:hypothetical protein